MKKYVHWSNNSVLCDAEEIEAKVEELKQKGSEELAVIDNLKTSFEAWASGVGRYYFEERGKYANLYYSERSDFGYDFTWMKCNTYKKADTIQDDVYPSECRKRIAELFQEKNGKTLYGAFGTVSSAEFKNCVPKPFYYLEKEALESNDARYIDVSSMYPATASGRLPDAKTARYMEGKVSPNEEYPFAFYLKSNHCAEYGVFDTHDYLKLPKRYRMPLTVRDASKWIYNDVKDEEEVTVLMKASAYEMTSTMAQIYEEKKAGDRLAKAVMVKGLGTLHKNPDKGEIKDYYHVAAIFEGRANQKQIEKVKEIEDLGGLVLQIIVDSIIYENAPDLGQKEKELGKYVSEFYGHKINYLCNGSINKYVIYTDDNEILKCVVSGVKNPQVEVPTDILKYKGE